MDPRARLRGLLEQAVAAAQPARLVPAALPAAPRGRTLVLGLGKGAWTMGAALESVWPEDRPLSGWLVAPAGSPRPRLRRLQALQGSHPVPDRRSLQAAQTLLNATRGLGPDDLVIALLSGGASSLATLPLPGLELRDLQAINQALLASGAPIDAINTLRKHLCALKGGRLAQACAPATVLTLAISDIPGDRLDLIGSGPTLADPSRCADALAVAAHYRIPLSEAALQGLRSGAFESPKQLPDSHAVRLLASPATALEAAARAARDQGLRVESLGADLQGEARELGAWLAQRCTAPGLYLSGGETTVRLRAATPGRGGRNTETLLAALLHWRDRPDVHALMADTDGIDGASPWAGATCGPETWARAQVLGLDLQQALDSHDAGGAFDRLGETLLTGPTGTNVNDFRAIWVA